MKKFLSLVLALVMTMSLVTISAGAKDFTDADKVTYTEAVDVLSAVKVIDGYTDGAFKPTTQLNRGQAAKIICNLILGPTTAGALVADAAPYKDVPANSTFAGYIAYCQKEGIISGYADGTFKPGNTLTGYAFMKMLLGALGYDATIEGYTGANWSINVGKQALGIDLDDGYVGSFDGTKAVTREEACLYAFNTLEATMVEYDSKTTVNVSGVEVQVGGSDAKEMEQGSYKSYTGASKLEDDTLEFCEKYFQDLKKDETTDDFGRPADTWKIKSTEIGTYANSEDMVASWTKKVTQDALYKAVGKTVVDDLEDGDATLTYYVDGVKTVVNRRDVSDFMDKNNTAKINSDASDTGKGVLTEAYVDDDNNTTVVVIRTYVFQATEDYSASKDSVKVTAAGDTDYLKITLDDYELDGSDFDIKDIKEDDYVLITCSKTGRGNKYEVQSVEKAELVSGEVNSYSAGDDVTIDGTKYEYSCTADTSDTYTVCEEIKSTGGTTTLVLDKYGYVIAVDDTVVSGNYVFISNTEKKLGNAVNAYAYFADGTSGEISLKKVGGETGASYLQAARGWYTYSKDSSDKYTLSTVGGSYTTTATAALEQQTTGKILINGNANLKDTGSLKAKANEKTVFITVDDDGDVDVATGISNAPDITVDNLTYVQKTDASGNTTSVVVPYIMGYVVKGNYATHVFISVEDQKYATVDSNSEDDVFVFVTKADSTKNNGTDDYWVWKAVVDGSEGLVETDYDMGTSGLMKLYTKVKTDNSTKFITGMDEVAVQKDDSTYAKVYFKDAAVSYKDGVLAVNSDTTLQYVTGTGNNGNQTFANLPTNGESFIVNGDSQLNLILNYSRGTEAKKDKDVQAMMTDTGAGHEVHGNMTGSSLKSTLSGYKVSGYFYVITDDDYIVGSGIDNTTIKYLFMCVNEATPDGSNPSTLNVTVNNVTVTEGQTATLKATVTGAAGDVTYAWKKDGSSTVLSTGSTLTIENAAQADSGKYICTVIDDDKETDSATATLTVNEKPAETMDVMVSYKLSNGTLIGKQLVNGVKAEGTKAYALLGSETNKALLTIPEGYDFVSADEPVQFAANGYATADVIVAPKTYTVTALVDEAGWTVSSWDTASTTRAGGNVVVTLSGSGDWSTVSNGTSTGTALKDVTGCEATVASATTNTVTVALSNVTGNCSFTIYYHA